MLVVVVIEARAQRGYTQSLKALQDVLSDQKSITFAEVRELLQYRPTESGPKENRFGQTYTFAWFSLFKSGQYQIAVTTGVDDNPYVMSFSTPNSPEEMLPSP